MKKEKNINIPKIVREAKEEFYRINNKVKMAEFGTDKHDELMKLGVESIIHERYGGEILDIYYDYLLKEM